MDHPILIVKAHDIIHLDYSEWLPKPEPLPKTVQVSNPIIIKLPTEMISSNHSQNW